MEVWKNTTQHTAPRMIIEYRMHYKSKHLVMKSIYFPGKYFRVTLLSIRNTYP